MIVLFIWNDSYSWWMFWTQLDCFLVKNESGFVNFYLNLGYKYGNALLVPLRKSLKEISFWRNVQIVLNNPWSSWIASNLRWLIFLMLQMAGMRMSKYLSSQRPALSKEFSQHPLYRFRERLKKIYFRHINFSNEVSRGTINI